MVAAGLVPPSPSRDTSSNGRPLLPALKTLSPGKKYTSAPLPTSTAPSPTMSRPELSLDLRSDTRSIDSRSEKRLPLLPSPLNERGARPWALGAYDNKLVSSTLSQLPPLPPLSPGGISSSGSNVSGISSPHVQPGGLGTSPSFSMLSVPSAPRAQPQPSGGVLVLPDGTKLANVEGARPDRDPHAVHQTIAHSGPNSPWSLLTVHVLPVFAGSPLKTPIEDLNSLCNQHIVGTSQRTPTSRLIMVLTNDLREFVASGMLTLKAKFEALEESKVVSRTAEVWNFFWGQILPYVEGVFLPFSQVRDVPLATSTPHQYAPTISFPPIAVRQILLSAFLVHILLPLLPRLVSLVTTPPMNDQKQRGATDLPRLLQMTLVMSTQARYTSFYPTRDFLEGEARDEETRDSVEDLSRAVRWSMSVTSDSIEALQEALISGTPQTAPTPSRPGLQRGPSVSQAGRLRRRPRESISLLEPEPRADSRWARIEEDDESDYSHLPHLTSAAPSTVRAGESLATITDQRTPRYPH